MALARMKTFRLERQHIHKMSNNLISSDFPKHIPCHWKFMKGEACMSLILAHEYARLWRKEQESWRTKTFPETVTTNIDLVKRYAASFKGAGKPKKAEKKKPFIMKKFAKAKKSFSTKRSPDDKAMRKREKKERKENS